MGLEDLKRQCREVKHEKYTQRHSVNGSVGGIDIKGIFRRLSEIQGWSEAIQ